MMMRKWFAAALAAVIVLLPISWVNLPASATTLAPSSAHIQVVHLAPFAEDASVTITLNGTPTLTDLGYGDSTAYIELPSGEYLAEVIPTGTATVAISATLNIEDGAFYTVIAYGDGANQDLGLMLLEDDLSPPTAGFFKIRLGHLAPFMSGTATADVRLADGTPILEDVNFGDVTGFLELPVGMYDLMITTPGGGVTLLNPVPVTLSEGDIFSAFVSGDGVNQNLAVFALPAGEEGFFLGEVMPPELMARVRVVHAVADAPPVSILVNSMPVPDLEEIAFKDVTDYVFATPGTYTITVVVPPDLTPVLTETLTVEEGEDYTLVALGTVDDEDGFPLSLLVFVDDNELPPPGMARARFFHLIPGAPDVDVAVKDGPELLTGVAYSQATEYVEVTAGTYSLELRPAGIPLPISLPDVFLAPGTVYSFFAVGTVAAPQIIQNVDATAPEPAQIFYFPFVNNP
jgi:hypothetical protein